VSNSPCTASTDDVVITFNQNPTAPTGTAGSRCGTGAVGISASVGAGETVDWYAAASSGTVLSGGTATTSFTTPSISSTTSYYAEARNTTTGCVSSSRTTVTATVNAANTAGSASSSPNLCINSALTNITHSTTGATGIGTATGLPTGVTAGWSSNTITISGTPTTSGVYNYSIPLTGGCGSVDATGTITVNVPTPGVSITQNNTCLWRGVSDTDYGTASNWVVYSTSTSNYSVASSLPTDATPVVIPAAQTCVSNLPTIASGTVNSDDLTIASGATLTIASGATLNLSGNLSNSGTLDNSGTINITGSWVNNGILTSGAASSVVFNGTSASTQMSGTNTFNNLTINGSGLVLTLNNDATVGGTLTLTNGNITTGASRTLIVSNSNANAISGGGTSSYIKGRLQRAVAGANTYVFPVGKTEYQEATLAFNPGYTSANILVFFTEDNTLALPVGGLTQGGTALTGILNRGFWSIDPVGTPSGSPTYSVTLKQRGYSNGVANAAQYTVIKRANSPSVGDWALLGNHSNITQAQSGGVVTAVRTGLTSFSDFGIGFGGGALPIELAGFRVECSKNNTVDVTWTTASEHNTNYFRVEKSRNGKQWDVLGTIGAAGNSTYSIDYAITDAFPNPGINYYRLVQYDLDGVYETFDIEAAVCKEQQAGTTLTSYPNPSASDFTVDLQTDESEGEGVLLLTDSKGAVIHSQNIKVVNGTNNYIIQGLDAAPGFYYITVRVGANTVTTKHSVK
jgi:hypothetical protein